ncbi:hypothetical protein [Pseudonocardia spirodelae]|uniref:Uncharacterized protein n=1 Tax=Pseudonocardia spirodelae TaxID=3133431 RepID=A0ABU8T3H2_9PSEU
MGTSDTTVRVGAVLRASAPVCGAVRTVVAHDVAHAGIALSPIGGLRRREAGEGLIAVRALRVEGDVYLQGGMPAGATPIFDDKSTSASVPGRRGSP